MSLNHIFFLGVRIESNLPVHLLGEAVKKISSHKDFHPWREKEIKEQERRRVKGAKWKDGEYEITNVGTLKDVPAYFRG